MVNVAQINHEPSTRTPDDKGQSMHSKKYNIIICNYV